MSHVSIGPLSPEEEESLDSLLNIAVSGPNESIYKISSTTFGNRAFIIGDGVAKLTVGTTQPTSPAVGDLWYDTN